MIMQENGRILMFKKILPPRKADETLICFFVEILESHLTNGFKNFSNFGSATFDWKRSSEIAPVVS